MTTRSRGLGVIDSVRRQPDRVGELASRSTRHLGELASRTTRHPRGGALVGPTETREAQFRDFVSARSAALLRVAFLVCGDLTLAEDLLQTALTRTYLAWRRLDGIDSLEAYSRRVLLNTATSWWRRRWRGERPTEVLPERAVSDLTEHLADRDEVWRLLATLPARQRAVI